MDVDQVHELEALKGILRGAGAKPIKISYGLLKTITGNFSIKIGRGSFGVVYKGRWKDLEVAVKKISNVFDDVSDKKFIDEIRCLRSADHENIVRLLGYCADTQDEIISRDGTPVMAENRNRMLCFEYVPNGNIRQYLKQEHAPKKYSEYKTQPIGIDMGKLKAIRTMPISRLVNNRQLLMSSHRKSHGDDWPARYKMIRGICQGLKYLHDKKINHRDLKPENVMLDAQMEPKIMDFGLSKFLDQGQSTLFSENRAGTLRYIAPETIDRGEISLKSDLYALGIIIIELLSGKDKISLSNWEESIDMDCPRARRCTEIARSCTDPDKNKRPTVDEVLSNLDTLESMIPWSFVHQSLPISLESTIIKIPSRSLTIAWVQNPKYWRWIPHPNARSGECAELLSVYYLKVSRRIEPEDLPVAATSYTAYLVYKLADSTLGLKDTVQTASTLHFDTTIATSKVSLHPKAPGASSAHGVTYPVTRGDGWLELRLGEFSNDRAVTVELLHEDPHKEMSGLIIDGMEIRRRP